MTSVGETLRRERERRNLGLDQIARETKISARMLEAIETGQFQKLPGGVFTRSFVRQYASVLELDGDELVAELDRVLEPPTPAFATAETRPAPSAPEIHIPKVEEWQEAGESRFRFSSSLPALAMVVFVMLVCAGVYAWWSRPRVAPVAAPEYSPSTRTQLPRQPAPPPQPAPQQAAPDQAAPNQPAPGQSGPPESAAGVPVQPPPAVPAQTGAPATQPQTTSPAPPRETPPQPAGGLPASPKPNPNATVHVQLTASEATWVLVRTDGKYLFSGTMQANETRSVDATGTVLVRLGNAAGVDISLNGRPVGAIGPKGQVRTVQFNASGFQIVPPTPKAAPAPDPLQP